jgi:hypothetical protein
MYLTFVRPIIPCFEAAYGAFPGALMVPCTDDMLIILPQLYALYYSNIYVH